MKLLELFSAGHRGDRGHALKIVEKCLVIKKLGSVIYAVIIGNVKARNASSQK